MNHEAILISILKSEIINEHYGSEHVPLDDLLYLMNLKELAYNVCRFHKLDVYVSDLTSCIGRAITMARQEIEPDMYILDGLTEQWRRIQ